MWDIVPLVTWYWDILSGFNFQSGVQKGLIDRGSVDDQFETDVQD